MSIIALCRNPFSTDTPPHVRAMVPWLVFLDNTCVAVKREGPSDVIKLTTEEGKLAVITISEESVEGCDPEEEINAILTVLFHEILHLVLGHLGRLDELTKIYGPDKMNLFNLAADVVVNAILFVNGFTLKPGTVGNGIGQFRLVDEEAVPVKVDYDLEGLAKGVIENVLSKSMEEIAKELIQKNVKAPKLPQPEITLLGKSQRPQSQLQPQSGSRLQPQSDRKDGDESEDKGGGEGKDSGEDGNSPLNGADKGDSEAAEEPTQSVISANRSPEDVGRTILRQAIEAARKAGTMPLGMERYFEWALTPPPQDLRRELMRFIRQTSMGKRASDWNRAYRFAPPNLVLPDYSRRKGLDLMVVVDTSGSITEKELEEFFGVLEGVLREMPVKMDISYHDTELYEGAKDVKTPKDLIRAARNARGGGGTDFRPVFKAAEKEKGKALILFTDGMGPWPESVSENLRRRTLVVLTPLGVPPSIPVRWVRL